MKAILGSLMMNKPEFKLLPCVFCTLGYNTYVAGYRVVSKTAELLTNKTAADMQPERLNQQSEHSTSALLKQKS